MRTQTPSFPSAGRRQRGATLVVAVILLLLLSIIVLLATNVGLQEQRTSGNDVRARIVHSAAEAGLNFGVEFFKRNSGSFRNITDPDFWTPCNPADETFPCGIIPQAERAGALSYTPAGLPTAEPLDFPSSVVYTGITPALGANTIPAGDFRSEVTLGAVLCPVSVDAAGCTADLDNRSETLLLSVVSRAQTAGEGSSTTLVQTAGVFRRFPNFANNPPITASGSVDVTGSLDLTTNPNAGGPGVPVTIWTRRDIDLGGSLNTCYLDEFIREGAVGAASPAFHVAPDGSVNTDVIICDNCRCPSDKSLSCAKTPSNSCPPQSEGIDFLDIDGNIGANIDVRLEEFPCDLFEFTFGVEVRTDTNGDLFCDTRIKVDDPDNPGNLIGKDDLFLRERADQILPNCSTVSAATSGLVWIQGNCQLVAGRQVGTPEAPVILVVDGQAEMRANTRLFGLLFVRAMNDVIAPNPGGDATLAFNGGGVIYGAAVVQGIVEKANGTAAVVYNESVLRLASEEFAEPELKTVGGSWTDRYSY